MSLSLAVITNGSPRLDRLLKWATTRPYIDEIRLFLDDSVKYSKDWTKLRVLGEKRAAAELIHIVNLDAAFAYAHAPEQIKTDWALHLGDDELMGQWFDEDIQDLMLAPYDVYSFPRYNLTAEDEYISSDPWYPDWCQRLFRPGYLVHEGEVHEGPKVRGRLGMARPHVFHFDFLDQTQKERSEKWSRYKKQGVVAASRGRGLPDDYYRKWSLPELYAHQEQKCEEPPCSS